MSVQNKCAHQISMTKNSWNYKLLNIKKEDPKFFQRKKQGLLPWIMID